MNPFGKPITNETLMPMLRYRRRSGTITQEDRAREAMRLIQEDMKNMEALNHALDLKAEYGSGVSTLVLIYNATGDTLEIVKEQSMDWLGCVYKEETPHTFENGQWVSFLHVRPTGPTAKELGSEGARVVRGKTIDGQVCDYLVAWFVPWLSPALLNTPKNAAYTEVREKDHYPQHWNYIKSGLLERGKKFAKDESHQYCSSTVSIGGHTTSELVVILKHKFSP